MLLPVSALGQPDPEAHRLPVALTRRQVEESPNADTGEELSPETENLARVHYHLSPVLNARFEDSHVRNLTGITGNTIEATDGEIGHAEDFLIDTATWQVRYMTVHASGWWIDEKRLISPQSIDWIDQARSIIHLTVTCQKVKDSPRYEAADTVDGAFEDQFHSYYGIRWVRR